jgi:L-2-amino-thiazoline-4-carboxylic acid hydrolase-like protein
MDIPFIEQVKIQAQALLPLVKALQAELGTERANGIVRKALAEQYRAYGERFWRMQGTRSFDEKMAAAFDGFAGGGALDYEVINKARDAFDVNVTGCRYAEFYKKLGVPELGFLLVCGADFPMAEGFGSAVTFTRTQTIMQGASHCDFRYALTNETRER